MGGIFVKITNNLKYLFVAILGLIFGLSILNVNAAPSSIKIKSKSSLYYYTEKKKTDYISGYNFYRKQMTDGTFAYCSSNINSHVPGGKTLSLKGEVSDKGLAYIVMNGYPNKSFTGNALKDYYITQSAIWYYFDLTRGSSNWSKSTFKSSSTGMKKYVYNLGQAAVKARNAAVVNKIAASVSSAKMDIKNGLFVSKTVNVAHTNTNNQYSVSIVSAPSGTVIRGTDGNAKTSFKAGESFYVTSPLQIGKGTIKLKLASKGVQKKVYEYTTKNSYYQDLIPVTIYDVLTDISTTIDLNYELTTGVKISKQDITSKQELAGATLVVKDASGKEVAKWVSTTTPHYIENLAAGNYTLTETIAPQGYKLSTETINFTVKLDGSVTTAVMYNEREITRVKISKKEMANGPELPGATLIVKNSTGKEVAKWVSTENPHYIEGLPEGTYTLTEEIAPKGYKLSSEKITFTLKADGTVQGVTMLNEREITKVKISKKEMANGPELPGATLIVKDSTGKEVAKWVSGNEPHYIEGLPEGTYTLTEEIAPKGYKLSSETIEFTLKADGTVQGVTMLNEREVTKVKISKKEMANGPELPGATLIVKDSTGKEVAKWVSTENPHYIEGLPEGTYTLTEEIAPKGYKLSSETIEFTLKADGTVQGVTMLNEREVTKVKISKKEMANGPELPGATLIVKDSTGKEVAKWVSGNEPHYIEGLPEGSYTLTEEIAPEGYKLSSETISFRLKANGNIESVTMYNEREITRVRISKQDMANSEELPGATLVIKDNTGKEVAKWVSGNEPLYIEGLKEGKYTLTEEIAPEGYKLSSETIEFTLKADGKVKSLTMYNEREVTKVKISKKEMANGPELPGATLVVKDKDGNIVDKWVSGNEPHYIEGLKEGTYTLTETIAPKGYKLSSETIEFTLKADGSIQTVTMLNEREVTKLKIYKKDIADNEDLLGATLVVKDKDGNEVSRWLSNGNYHYVEGLPEGTYTLTEEIAPEGYELSNEVIKFSLVADGKVQSIVMYNTKITVVTKVSISKQDITTSEELSGATLVVKDKDGNEVAKWVSTNTPHYIEGLEPGEYTLTEIQAPNGYRLSTETVNFTVKEDGSLTTAVMYNAKKVVKLSVQKQDLETKEKVIGAVLQIKNQDGQVVDKWISSTEPHYTEELPEGSYVLEEVEAPNGYKLNTTPVKFTLVDSDKITNVVIYNEKKEVTKVRISKQDITNKTELPGATLIVKDKNGNEVDRWVSTTTPHYIEGLSVGEYTLTELIAPYGFVLSSETIKFTIKDDGKVTEVVMYNEPKLVSKVVISKQDITTKTELAGATLVIYDINGNIVDKWISGTNAHYIEGLDSGEYTLREINAPEGYVLSDETIKFTVNEDGNVTRVVMYNTKLVKVPITDLNLNSMTVVLGSIISFIGAAILVFYKKIVL